MLSANRRNFRIISPYNGRGESRQPVAFSLPHKTSLDPQPLEHEAVRCRHVYPVLHIV